MALKIVVCDHIHQSGLDLLQAQNDIAFENLASLPKDELRKAIKDADVVITRSSTDVDEAFLEHAQNLKSIVRAGVGVDNVDIPACSKKGIVVMNVPTANTIAAVELTMAHLISSVRNFPGANQQLKGTVFAMVPLWSRGGRQFGTARAPWDFSSSKWTKRRDLARRNAARALVNRGMSQFLKGY